MLSDNTMSFYLREAKQALQGLSQETELKTSKVMCGAAIQAASIHVQEPNRQQLVHGLAYMFLALAKYDQENPVKAVDYEDCEKILQDMVKEAERRQQIEDRAKSIYEGQKSESGWVPWKEWGNSLKQDEARRQARIELFGLR